MELRDDLVTAGYSEAAFWEMTLDEVEVTYEAVLRRRARERVEYLHDMRLLLGAIVGDKAAGRRLGEHIGSLVRLSKGE